MGVMFTTNQYNAVKTYCERIVKRAKANLRRKKKMASGALYDSIRYKINRQKETFYFEYDAYGQFIESGRRRGAALPPIKPLEKWIKQRGLNLSAWAVAKSIQKKGIKPVPFITPEIDKSEDELVGLLEEAIEKDLG